MKNKINESDLRVIDEISNDGDEFSYREVTGPERQKALDEFRETGCMVQYWFFPVAQFGQNWKDEHCWEWGPPSPNNVVWEMRETAE